MTWNDRMMISRHDDDYVPSEESMQEDASSLDASSEGSNDEGHSGVDTVSRLPMTPKEMIEDLASRHHCILSLEYVRHVYLVFQLTGPRFRGMAADGSMESHQIAEDICLQLCVPYEKKTDRGFALREYCGRLRHHYAKYSGTNPSFTFRL